MMTMNLLIKTGNDEYDRRWNNIPPHAIVSRMTRWKAENIESDGDMCKMGKAGGCELPAPNADSYCGHCGNEAYRQQYIDAHRESVK